MLLFKSLLAFLLLRTFNAQDQNPGSLRLVNSTHTFVTSGRGRLEIYLNSQWGTVCDDGFGAADARLACNQLGFSTYTRYGSVRSLGYPQASSSTPIWISNLACDYSDLTVYHCSRSSGTFCSHSEDVAIECSSPYQARSSAIRLVAKNEQTSPFLTAGRVDVFYVGRWGTICNDGFSSRDAAALCHILTGSSTVLAYGTVGSSRLRFDQGPSSSPVWIEDLRCTYDSSDARYYCNHDGLGINDCTHAEDIAISCRADGAVRLISSLFTSSTTDPGGSAGRLEIYYNGRWGTVCDDGFGQTDADVVCQQLGYNRASRYGNVRDQGYSSGTGTIWLTNVGCTSSDVFLANCTHNVFGNTFCSHSEDVAISCTQSSLTTSIVLSGSAIAGIVFGVIGACCCCIVCIGIICSQSSNSRSTTRTPRTVNVAASRTTSTPRTTATAPPAAAVIMTATKTEMFVYKPQQEPPSAYPQAQTYAGEAPPDYHSACNYPKVEAL